jgi:hypothetical protein
LLVKKIWTGIYYQIMAADAPELIVEDIPIPYIFPNADTAKNADKNPTDVVNRRYTSLQTKGRIRIRELPFVEACGLSAPRHLSIKAPRPPLSHFP